jgi:hypothetical protein
LVGHSYAWIVSLHGSLQLSGVNPLALCPLNKIARAIRWVSAPPLEHAGVDRLVDVDVGSVVPNIWLSADAAIKGPRKNGVQSLAERMIGINNRRFQRISIQSNFRTERKSMQRRLLHQPAQRSLSKKIALIAASHIGMGTYKPALLNAGERARRRDWHVRIFPVVNVPKCGSEVAAVLIDGKGVITVLDWDE